MHAGANSQWNDAASDVSKMDAGAQIVTFPRDWHQHSSLQSDAGKVMAQRFFPEAEHIASCVSHRESHVSHRENYVSHRENHVSHREASAKDIKLHSDWSSIVQLHTPSRIHTRVHLTRN